MRRVLLLGLVALLGLGTARAEAAYPDRSIRLIVPFAAGGGTDAQARILSAALSERLGQSVVVENLGGAGGTIGTNEVARADADGYTLLAATPALTINPYIQRNIPYNPLTDFTPVIQTTTSPTVMVVPPNSPIRSVQGLIDEARAHPGEVKFGSAGIGSMAHLGSALFAAKAHVRMTHIPYRGSGPALIDLMAGRLQVQFENAPAVMPLVRNGQLRAVAVGTAGPSPLFPGLPTIAATVPGYEWSSWFGILAPARTPPTVIARLNAALNEALHDPAVQKRLTGLGLDIVGGSPASFGAFLKQEVADMKVAAEAANLKPE